MRAEPPHRAAFPVFRPIPTRWSDNDAYGHVNNVVYYGYFDTLVNARLVETGLLDIEHGPLICLVVASDCAFFAPLAFPQAIEGGLSVARLGTSSVVYRIGIFAAGAAHAAAAGHLTHVLVDRTTRRPQPFPPAWRANLGQLCPNPPA